MCISVNLFYQVETSVLNSNGLQSPLTTQQTNPALIPGTPQYRQAQLLGRQIAARQEAHLQVLRDLSRSERWASMTPGEQNAVLMQQLAQIVSKNNDMISTVCKTVVL